jgi:hypothetical protein
MAMKRQHEPWADDIDLARVSADRRSIAAGWVVVFVIIALGTVLPPILPLVHSGYAVAMHAAAASPPRADAARACGAADVGS